MWVFASICSAIFLGFYEVARKHAVNENAVIPVLLGSTLFGAALVTPVIVLSKIAPVVMQNIGLYVPILPVKAHFYLIIKAIIVASSWTMGFFALKHLPISIFTPIRATSPFWTLIGAILIFHEQPNTIQWFGLMLILLSYYAFALLGSREGISFHRNKWIYLLIMETIIGSMSGLYDKLLIQKLNFSPIVVLTWFSFYIVLIFFILTLALWYPQRKNNTPFQWRWSIPMVGILLVFSDFIYFYALSYSAALIVLVIAIRRMNVVISFLIGSLWFKEVNKKLKFLALSGVLAGILLLVISS